MKIYLGTFVAIWLLPFTATANADTFLLCHFLKAEQREMKPNSFQPHFYQETWRVAGDKLVPVNNRYQLSSGIPGLATADIVLLHAKKLEARWSTASYSISDFEIDRISGRALRIWIDDNNRVDQGICLFQEHEIDGSTMF